MSGETEQNVSSWTTDSLKAHLQLEIDNLRIMLDSRFAAEQSTIRDLLNAEVDVLRQRLSAMDKATELLNEQVTQVPTDVDKQVGNLKELHAEKFDSVKESFVQRDVALTAALAAQEKQAAKQEQTFKESIEKQEKVTADAIANLSRLVDTSIKALGDKIDGVKENVVSLSQTVNGAAQNKVGGSAAQTQIIAFVLFLLTIAGFGITIITKLH